MVRFVSMTGGVVLALVETDDHNLFPLTLFSAMGLPATIKVGKVEYVVQMQQAGAYSNDEARGIFPKIAAIKIVRTYTFLGLKDAKDLVEGPGKVTFDDLAKAKDFVADLSAKGISARILGES